MARDSRLGLPDSRAASSASDYFSPTVHTNDRHCVAKLTLLVAQLCHPLDAKSSLGCYEIKRINLTPPRCFGNKSRMKKKKQPSRRRPMSLYEIESRDAHAAGKSHDGKNLLYPPLISPFLSWGV